MSDEVQAPPDAKELGSVDLEGWEKKAILAVRYKRDAKAAAENYLFDKDRPKYRPRVQPKEIRGRCCLFVDGATYTDFFGHTWQEAFMALVFRTKLQAQSAQARALKKEIQKAEAPK